jgi:hypothetical protein
MLALLYIAKVTTKSRSKIWRLEVYRICNIGQLALYKYKYLKTKKTVNNFDNGKRIFT